MADGGSGQPAQVSDVFSGTAQAYSLLQANGRGQQFDHTHSTAVTQQQPAVQSHAPSQDAGPTPQDSGPSVRGRGQLEVLYGARCRQVEVLSQQLRAAQEEGERQTRVLRHEKVRE